MRSSIRDDPTTYLLRLVEDLQKRVRELERSSLTSGDVTIETLRLGTPSVYPEGIGDASFEGSIIANGYLNLGAPVTSATTAGNMAISGNANIEGNLTGGTHTHTGLVTGGDAHDHDGGDGGQIPTGGLANDSVDDTKAGDRVPQFYRREGGSSSNWSTVGTTGYTPTAVRIQAGAITAAASDTTSVSFPTSFGNAPIVILNPTDITSGSAIFPTNASSSGFDISNGYGSDIGCTWLAIGPE